MRNGRVSNKLENCAAVFVTSNTPLVACVCKYFEKDTPIMSIPLILDNVYLTTRAWLKSSKKKINLSLLNIIANATAAIRPSDSFRAAAIKKIDDMEANGSFTTDEATMIRYNKFRKKKRHGLQKSGRMKLRHAILKGDNKPCPKRLYS